MIKKLLLPFFWLLSLLVIFMLSDSFTDKSQHFFGIAGEREQTISFQYPVEIVQIFVTDGKNVEQGELMLEVKRHQLDNELTMLEQEIRGFELQKQETNNAINSQLAGLSAKKQAISADMDYQIHVFQLRLKMNAEMVNSISSSGVPAIAESTELGDLKRKRHFLIQGIQSEIKHLTGQLNAVNRPIDMRVNELLQRKAELLRQNVGLKVNAQFDGRIGSVNFKAGELVSPFLPIISVQSRNPRHIKGYIHEHILNDVEVGQVVWVKSITLNQAGHALTGIVESMGNRIVEYPERLKKNPAVPAWGREVLVRLDKLEHDLLFGEKVQVFLENPEQGSKWFNVINEASSQTVLEEQFVGKIKSSHSKLKAKKIEASGLLWIPEEEHYLLVSDEQFKHQASLFIMDEDGTVSAGLPMGAQGDVDDLESISTDGDYIYLLSSLSHNKRDQLKAKRKKLLRFRYKNKQVIGLQSIDLYDAIKKLRDELTDISLVLFLKQAIKAHNLDIESHAVVNQDLYLGFKTPFINSDKTLIMKVNNSDALFGGAAPQAEIWRTIPLRDPETGEPMLLSDMIMADGQWFLLGVSRSSADNSVLWHYQPESEVLKHIQTFPGLKAEGVAYQPEKTLLTVVFDGGGNKHSKYLSVPFPAARLRHEN